MDCAVERRYLTHLPYPRSINLERGRGRPKQPPHVDNEPIFGGWQTRLFRIGERGS